MDADGDDPRERCFIVGILSFTVGFLFGMTVMGVVAFLLVRWAMEGG